jgi:hypothetical protein
LSHQEHQHAHVHPVVLHFGLQVQFSPHLRVDADVVGYDELQARQPHPVVGQ